MCPKDPAKPTPPDKKKGDQSHYADPCTKCVKTSLHVKVVHDTTGKPLEKIKTSVSGKPTLVTAANGWARWDPIAVGVYDVSARDDGYEPDPAKKTGVDVSLGEKKEVELRLKPIEWRLHVDADRDGTVDPDWTDGQPWQPGAGKKGAVVLVNSDRDDPARGSKRDFEDEKVNTGADVSDLSPLDLRRTIKGKAFPPGTKATLTVASTDKIRIFDSRTAGGKELIGKKKGNSHTWTHKEMVDVVELGMEALEYNVKPGDKGEVELKLEVELSGTKLYEQKVTVRVSPFMIFNHLQKTKRVHVWEGTDNKTFVKALKKTVTGAGVPLGKAKEASYPRDRWTQDVMEPGFSSHTASGLRHVPAIMRAIRGRAFELYARDKVMEADQGFVEPSTTLGGDTLNSFGNLECSPPIISGGKAYPLGRIIHGGKSPRRMVKRVRDFLNAQLVQEPVEINTSWLRVGHVDEFVSFLPYAKGTHKFALILASPKLALDILKKAPPTAKLTRGFAKPDGPGGAADRASAKAHYKFRTAKKFLDDASIVGVQATVQGEIDKVKTKLQTELRLKNSDIVELPVLFEETSAAGQFIAYTAGVVNMLVLTKSSTDVHLAVPKPFGPTRGGKCAFEKEVVAKLGGIGIAASKIDFIDDFCTYHVLQGEIHCGTNSEREPPSKVKWWEIDWI